MWACCATLLELSLGFRKENPCRICPPGAFIAVCLESMQRGLLWPRMLNSDYLRREQSIASGVMMFNRTTIVSVFAVSLFTIFSPAKADFVGQTILGPLSAGSSVTGSTAG